MDDKNYLLFLREKKSTELLIEDQVAEKDFFLMERALKQKGGQRRNCGRRNCLIKDILNHNSCVLFSDNSVISMVQETAKKFQFGEEGSKKRGANETCEKQ